MQSIAFVTYAQAICGLRCQNILNQYQVGADDDGQPQRIVVKCGTKELTAMLSVQLVSRFLCVACQPLRLISTFRRRRRPS